MESQIHITIQRSQHYLCFYIPYLCINEHLHLCSKPTNAHSQNMVYHILIFTSMFPFAFATIIKVIYENCINKTICCGNEYFKTVWQQGMLPTLIISILSCIHNIGALMQTCLAVSGNFSVPFVSVHALYSDQWHYISHHFNEFSKTVPESKYNRNLVPNYPARLTFSAAGK
jgi:hypothetical protein